MRTILVDTVQDTVAADGRTSLREALAQAATGGPARIVFDPALTTAPGSGAQIALNGRLVVAAGSDVTIDGRIGLRETIRIDGGFSGNAFGPDKPWLTVEAGARATVAGMEFVNAFVRGANGSNATPGTNGLNGNNGIGSGAPGSNGNSGTAAFNNATDAPQAMSVAGIENRGDLTLSDVRLAFVNAFGGSGGNGAAGGNGGNGGKGQAASFGPGGFGGNGGIGAAGSDGRDGSDVTGAILNTGSLMLRDVRFENVNVYGGHGGAGGAGGRGGSGGPGGKGAGSWSDGAGGSGGSGGNGGSGGDAARAVALVWNRGTVEIDGPLARPVAVSVTAGVGGQGGSGGNAGGPGTGDPPGARGTPGTAGADGRDGTAALFSGTGRVETVANTVVVRADKAVVAELGTVQDRTVTIGFERFGDATQGARIAWDFTPGAGLTRADFEGPLPRGGVVRFAEGESFKTLSFTMRHTAGVEGDETFAIALRALNARVQAGAADGATVTVRDAEIAGTGRADRLTGSDGPDRIFGRGGRDTIEGGAGDDTIDGGAGADVLRGGPGNDVFVFAKAAHTRPEAPDVIEGYQKFVFGPGGDRIDLRGIDADTTQPGRQAFVSANFATFTGPRQLRIETDGDDTRILLNTDRDPEPEAVILVRGVTGLTTFDDLILF